MSCEKVQELISYLLDGKGADAERGEILAHIEVCRECGAHYAWFETQRAALRRMAQSPVPDQLAAQLRVLASHERERRLGRVNWRVRIGNAAARISLAFDNLMRPVALPVTGGLLTALLIFGLLAPRLALVHRPPDRDTEGLGVFSTPPVGRMVTNPYDEVGDADADFPRIESAPEDFLNVVELTIDETGKVVDWRVVRGEMTMDMKSVIVLSRFEPATNMGVATSGKVYLVQHAPSATVHG